MLYSVWISEDRMELNLQHANGAVPLDTDSRPMKCVHRFEAESWEQAKDLYKQWFDTAIHEDLSVIR